MGQMLAGHFRRLWADATAASAVEYAVLLALIIAVVFATIQVIGTKVANGFNNFDNSFKP